jgi:FkbH-like protein
MKLREALQLAQRPAAETVPYAIRLVSGFEPLHLRTFLSAHARLRLESTGDRTVAVETGLFGDFGGNLERASEPGGAPAPMAVVLEWSDLHPWLGWREAGFAPDGDSGQLLAEVESRLNQWTACWKPGHRAALALPALPLPPWVGQALPHQRSRLAIELHGLLADWARQAARCGVRVVEAPAGPAWDAAKHLANGFPYTLEFTDALARHLAAALLPATPKKGLVTDLDQTLWSGVVGDDGPAGVHWDLDHQARIHGWWQQFLAALAAQGTLLAVASKNDAEPVAAALARPDLLVPGSQFFPVETHWEDKAASLRRIAAAWNVGLDSLVFVDDNPWEIESVREALPEVECFLFPAAGQAAEVAALLAQLRDRFGVEQVSEEDRLRAASLRQREAVTAELAAEAGRGAEQRLARLGARLRVDLRQPPAARALELLNKTNQFNLNGQRWNEADWLAWCARPEARVALLGYEDRFGPLGNIAVVAAELQNRRLAVRGWVMSCRAFARRIEFATLQCLLDQWPCDLVEFHWQRTERNGPTAAALELLTGAPPPSAKLEIPAETLRKSLPPLYLEHCEILEIG